MPGFRQQPEQEGDCDGREKEPPAGSGDEVESDASARLYRHSVDCRVQPPLPCGERVGVRGLRARDFASKAEPPHPALSPQGRGFLPSLEPMLRHAPVERGSAEAERCRGPGIVGNLRLPARR